MLFGSELNVSYADDGRMNKGRGGRGDTAACAVVVVNFTRTAKSQGFTVGRVDAEF